MGGSSKNQITGYAYSMGVHMGISRGPIDELRMIKVGDREAWPLNQTYDDNTYNPTVFFLTRAALFADEFHEEGIYAQVTDDPNPANNGIYQKVGPLISGHWVFLLAIQVGGEGYGITASQDFMIQAPNLFGGEQKEGGIQGQARLMMGERTQIVPDWVRDLMGVFRVPGWRGVTTLFYRGLISNNNPYPKTWKFRVRRAVKGWQGDDCWYPEKAKILLAGGTIHAMNPVHIIYEAATNKTWGRGLDRTRLNDAVWRAAADTIYDEAFGMCIKWNRIDKLSAFVQSVINHIGASVYIDRGTGLLDILLIRGGYDVDSIPHFGYGSGLLNVEKDDAAANDDPINEIVVTYRDPITNTDKTARAQNLAARASSEAGYSTSVSYPGLPTFSLADRVAHRDLKARATALKRMKVTLDRRAWQLAPGQVFSISAPDRGITKIILRAGKVEDGRMTEGAMTISAVQDVFGLPATAFNGEQQSGWQPPNTAVSVPIFRRLMEATYRQLYSNLSTADLNTVSDDVGTVIAMAVRPTALSQSFVLASKADGEDYAFHGEVDFAPAARLVGALSVYATTITLTEVADLSRVVLGDAALIDNEIVQVSAYDAETGVVTIVRGCVDTIPVAHAANTVMWFFDSYSGSDFREYLNNERVTVKMLTKTSSDILPETDAPENFIDVSRRHSRPYPPGKVLVNGAAPLTNAVVVGAGVDIVLTWAGRNRITQQDQLVGHASDNINGEPGTTYTVRVYKADGTNVRVVPAIDALTFTYTAAMALADAVGAAIVFELESVRNGFTSFQGYHFTVNRG